MVDEAITALFDKIWNEKHCSHELLHTLKAYNHPGPKGHV